MPHSVHHGGHRGEKYRPRPDSAAGSAPVRPVHPPRAEADAGRPAEQPPRRRRRVRTGAGDAAQYPHHPGAGAGRLHGAPLRSAYFGRLRRHGAHQFLRRHLFAGSPAAERRGGGHRHAAVRLRKCGNPAPFRHVCWHVGGRYQLHIPHFCPH